MLQVSSTSGNQNFTTFNTLNAYILKGDGAAGMGLIFDALMTGNADEPDSLYGLVARAVEVSADKNAYRFLLRKEARFHDGSPLRGEDVAFSLNILRTKGHPSIRQSLRDVDAVEAEADDVVVLRLKKGHSRETALIAAGQPIFSAAYYKTREFDETTLEPPLGSGAYRVGRFDQGHFISFDRVPDYWGKDLPVNVGQANFDRVRFEYFADRKVAFEAFKAGIFTFREEFTSAVWATGYDFAAVKEGRVKRAMLPERIADRERKAGSLTCGATNSRTRGSGRLLASHSISNGPTPTSCMASIRAPHRSFRIRRWRRRAEPSPQEVALLEPYRSELPAAVFGPAYVPPVSDGSGQDRQLLRRANSLLIDAGCKRQGSVTQPAGRQTVRDRVSGFRRRARAAYRAFHKEPEAARHRGPLSGRRRRSIQAPHRRIRL